MKEGYGVCPVCDGTKIHDGRDCRNCGGQTMFGSARGEVPFRADGTPCKHEYTSEVRGRCYTVYKCKHCSYGFDIDSGD